MPPFSMTCLPLELKWKILDYVFEDKKAYLLFGSKGLVVISFMKGEGLITLNNLLFYLSNKNLREVKDVRYTSAKMYNLLKPDVARALATKYLHHLFRDDKFDTFWRFLRGQGDLCYHDFLKEYHSRRLTCRWLHSQIVIYSAKRGTMHKTTDIFTGILHSFEFEEDKRTSIRISKHSVTPTRDTEKSQEFRYTSSSCFAKRLASDRDMGVYACLCAVKVGDMPIRSYEYGAMQDPSHLNKKITLVAEWALEQHLCDVWNDWSLS